MTGGPAVPESFDWSAIDLVVFDVDGTLYRQSGMRRAMARDLALHCLRRRSLTPLRVLRAYRARRETLGAAGAEDFEARAREAAAQAAAASPEAVAAIVAQWMDTHPLRYLDRLRYGHVAALFETLRRSGRRIGVLSDFPAAQKMAALGLRADIVVAATDAEVMRCKPHPRGLEVVMRRAGAAPSATLMIGDRWERDGLAAQAAGTRFLLRGAAGSAPCRSFAGFDDPLFAPLAAAAPAMAGTPDPVPSP